MSSPTINIHSTSSSRELILSNKRDEYFQVEIKSLEISAALEIWTYTDAASLNKLLQEIGSENKPWHGERTWSAIEENFSLTATCSSLGEVTFQVMLHGAQGSPEEWKIQCGLVLEFGQLEKIAKQALVFFNETRT